MKKLTAITLFGLAGASFALQGGPTQPDYIEFEPSGMKDMVDLTSGNFAYSIPLGEVPGAYGSYPLSLSYHAGISPQKEATWVGLGWTLSPGSIVRDMRGVPDDQFHGGTLGFVYLYYGVYDWRIDTGYSYGYFSVGVSASRLGGVGASAGVGFMVSGCVELGFKVSSDEGFGPTAGVGFGPKTGENSRLFGLNASAMYSPRTGDWTLGAGASVNGEKIGASVGVHYTTGHEVTYRAGMSARSKNEGPRQNVVSMSVRKNGTAASVGPVGISVANSSTNANSKSSSTGFNIVVPTYVGVFSLGFSQTLHEVRMRSATSDYVYGYMYQGGPAIMADGANNIEEIPDAMTGSSQSDKLNEWSWTYRGRTLETLGDDKMQPAYDMFTIESEGVSGTFRAFTREEQQMFGLASNRATHQYGRSEEEKKKNPEKLEYYSPILELDDNRWPNEKDFVYSGDKKVNSEYKYYKVSPSFSAAFADYKTQFRNEGNRMVYRDDKNSDEPLTSGIEFLFLGEGGYYESEGYGSTKSDGAGKVTGKQLKRVFQDENDPTKTVEYALHGSRKVEPIFEDKNNPVSKLEGFVVTNSDGTKYFFTKPVKSYLNVDYTINQEKGTPVFVDKKLSKNDGFWSNFGEGLLELFYPPKLLRGIKQAMTGVLDAKCGEDYSDENILYSYQVNLNPYATQWLLTEIQGPDYIQLDKENNDISKTIGYNVRFHYTDPSLYQWRSPYAKPNTNWSDLINFRIPRNGMTPDGCDTKMYQASFGVKEYVYLESIETATHKVKFEMNDPTTEARVDGKGWYFDKRNKEDNKKALPILTIAAVSVNVKSVKNDIVNKINVYNLENTDYPLENVDKDEPIKNWHEAKFEYDALYINTEIPELLQNKFKTNPTLSVESDYLAKFIHLDDDNLILLKDFRFVFDVDNSSKDKIDETSGEKFNILEKTSGYESKFGLYKIKLKKGSGVSFYWQDNSTNHSLFNQAANGKVKLVLGQKGARYIIGDDNKVDDEIYLKQCALKQNVRNIQQHHQNPIIYTYYAPCDDKNDLTPPLLDWSDIVFAEKDDPSINQMRYLKKISYYNKKDKDNPYREYKFEYDYSLHPKALNSYCGSRYPMVPSDIQNSPIDAGLDICSVEDKTRHLYGKLTLKSITETGCQNGRCSSLPPFKFDYNVASQTSTRYSVKNSWMEYAQRDTPEGQKNREIVEISSSSGGSSSSQRKFFSEDYWGTFTDIDASILASVNNVDEWGFWNIYGTEYNHKVSMSFADYGAAAWSLNKVTDPAGGVMEIKYERDEYKNGEDHANEHLIVPIFRVGRCGDFVKKDQYNYTPVDKSYDHSFDDKTCGLFFPMYWHEQCLGPRTAFWDYKAPRGHKGGDYDYMDTLGIFKDGEINHAQTLYFKLNTELTTKIPCGFGGWFNCDRYRQVGLFGSTTVLEKYDGTAYNVWNGDLPFEYLKEYYDGYLAHAQYVSHEARMLVFDEDYRMINVGVQKAADQIRDDLTWDTIYVEGNIWSKRGYKSIKGGDLRVKSLVRYDIDRTAKTEYEYEPGEMAQLPDSAYTTVMGSGFNTDKYSFALPDVNVNPKSRIIGIEDDDLLYVPGSIVMYPKVTVKNSDDKGTVSNGKMVFEYITPEKGIPEEYIDSETKQSLRPFIRVNVNFTTWGGDNIDKNFRARPSVLTFSFHGCTNGRPTYQIGNPMNVLLQPDRTTSFSFYDNNVKNVCGINVKYIEKGGKEAISKMITLLEGFNEVGHFNDFNEAMLTVSYIEDGWQVHPAWYRTQEQGYYPILYKEVAYSDDEEIELEQVEESDKPLAAQKIKPHFEKSIVYHDFTAFLGMNTKISSYRGNEDKSILLRVDSNVYSTRVPDILDGIAKGSDVAKKIGNQVERWKSKNELQCVDDDLKECKRLQWSLAAHNSKTKTLKNPNNGENEKVYYYQNGVSFAYKRYPAFQTASITSTGFDNQQKQFDAESSSSGTGSSSSSSVSSSSAKSSSSSCDYRCVQNNKRRFWSKIENHRYDPVTSNPTVALAKIKYADNGEELRKLTVKLPHHAVYENSSSSATTMARRMYKKNMLSQNYAEFIYSDSIPVNSSTSWDNLEKIKYLKSFNMKPMKKYSGSLTYTDNSQVESYKYPYIEWGSFTTKEMPKRMFSNQDSRREAYRFVAKYHDIESSSSMNWPDKSKFSGNHILSVDKYFRTIEVEDVQGRIVSSHYTEDGLHQTGIFFPASRNQTASLVPVGNEISAVNVVKTVVDELKIEAKKGEMVAQSTITLNSSSFNCSGELIVEYRVKKSGKKWKTVREKLSDLSLKLNKGEVLNYLRVYPDNAEAKTYLYDKYGNIIQIVAEDNLSTYFEYNPLGQLIQTRNDDGVSFKSHHREFTNDDRDEIKWEQNNSSSSGN